MNIIDRILGESKVRPPTEQELTDPHRAYDYAKDVIGGRWPEGEAAIAKNAYRAYDYAKDVIGGRWPEGEPAIAKDRDRAYAYAKDVIGGRWPEAEEHIATHPTVAYQYAKDVIGGPWPKAEAAVATDPRCAERYVDMIVNKRVPEDIESDYVKKEIYAQKYLKNFPDRKLSWAVKGWIPFGDTTDVWGI